MAHILIDRAHRCTCDCASKCLIGKTGSSHRCTKPQIEELGHSTIQLKKRFLGGYRIVTDKKLYNV